jgi:tripartite-type tricarboxylate transporter receptor subunit TctC
MRRNLRRIAAWLASACTAAAFTGTAHAAWAPTQPVELVVPAGTGGGADQMARLIQALVAKHRLMTQPIAVVNKTGNSGAEGLLDVRAAHGNPHKLLITLSSLFTVPLATGVEFSWRELTPVSMLALDQFVLWVNAASPYQTTQDFVKALQSAPAHSIKLGGTGTKQEDQLLGVLLEAAVGGRLQYVPLKGGGDVAKALAAGEVDATVNNPIEAAALWRQGKLRPLCVFDSARLEAQPKPGGSPGWPSIPTCMSSGIPTQYLMLRGIFMAPGTTPEQRAYFLAVLDKLRALPEWREFMAEGAFRQTAMNGAEFTAWLDRNESFHRVLMREAKLMAPR